MNQGLLAKLPPELRSIAKRLADELKLCRVYLVGGAVRDIILDRPTKDYDLVITGLTPKALEKWLQEHGQVNLVGRTFGVFKWQPAGWSGEAIDVALPRTEHVTIGTGQYRDFSVRSDPNLPIEEDLKRRDFTINALALDLADGRLIDPTHGQADLDIKLLRAVGEPAERLAEDLSRVLRCLRQACELDFSIDESTWVVIKNYAARAAAGTLANNWLVPREVVARELLKSLKLHPAHTLELWDEAGLLRQLIPEVTALHNTPQPPEFHNEGDVFEHTKLALSSVGGPEWKSFFGQAQASLNTLVATLLHDIGKPLTLKTPPESGVDHITTYGHDTAGAALVPDICLRLKLTSYVDPERGQVSPETVAWLVQHHLLVVHGSPDVLRPSTIYRYFLREPQRGQELQHVIFLDMHATRPQDGHSLTGRLKQLQDRINEVGSGLKAGQLKLLLNGRELMSELELAPGPTVGRLLELLEEAQLEGKVKTRAEALSYLKQQI